LTESDGPFIDFNNQPSRPRDIKHVVSYLSNLFNIDPKDMENQIKCNFGKLLKRIKH
jgi:Tat protein secretion system quality control protein TatD with DNase activity